MTALVQECEQVYELNGTNKFRGFEVNDFYLLSPIVSVNLIPINALAMHGWSNAT